MSVGSWVGKRMKNPDGEIGVVIDDLNGVHRILTVKFDDGTTSDIWLSNSGEHPKESWLWCWEWEKQDGSKEWAEWGRI